MKICNQVTHLPRFSQPCLFLDATHGYIWRSLSINHSPGICKGGFYFHWSETYWAHSPLLSWWWCCPGTLPTHPGRPVAVAALDFHVIGITQQNLASYTAACNFCLVQPGLPCCCWGTRHYGTCLVPTHSCWAHIPRPMRLQVGQHGVLLACISSTSLVSHSVPCDSLCRCICCCCLEICSPSSHWGYVSQPEVWRKWCSVGHIFTKGRGERISNHICLLQSCGQPEMALLIYSTSFSILLPFCSHSWSWYCLPPKLKGSVSI